MNTLTAAQVSCVLGDIEIVPGTEDELFKVFELDRGCAYTVEDGTDSGDVHFFLDVTTAIALTGHMMMMGESIISEQVETRAYSEEIQEGFMEIANQVVGAMNTVVERKLKGGHLILKETKHVQYGDVLPTIKEDVVYLLVHVDIQVGGFPAQPAFWLISKGFAEALLDIEIPDPNEGVVVVAAAPKAKAERGGPDLSAYAGVGVEVKGGPVKPDLSAYAGVGREGDDGLEMPDLSAYAKVGTNVDEEGNPRGINLDAYADEKNDVVYVEDGLPNPNDPGGVKALMTEVPFSLKDTEKVIRAINAMRQEGHRYIGIDDDKGKLTRVITRSDLRQLMGPFFGTKAMNARDKAICTVLLGKINKDQRLVRIALEGTINQAADLITEFELKALPVVSSKGVLRGFIPVHQILKYFRKKRRSMVSS